MIEMNFGPEKIIFTDDLLRNNKFITDLFFGITTLFLIIFAVYIIFIIFEMIDRSVKFEKIILFIISTTFILSLIARSFIDSVVDGIFNSFIFIIIAIFFISYQKLKKKKNINK